MSDTSKESSGWCQVSRLWKESGVVAREEADEELIEVPMVVEGAMVANVSFGNRLTLNMGNYESCQLSVAVTIPCYLPELNTAYKAAKSFVDMKMAAESRALKEYRSSK